MLIQWEVSMSDKLKILTGSGSVMDLSADAEISSKFLGPTWQEDWSWQDVERTSAATAPVERRLAVIAFVQVAGFPGHLMIDDTAAVQSWLDIKKSILKVEAERHQGQIAFIGTAKMLLEFKSAVAAVRWAIAVQKCNRARLSQIAGERLQLQISIGLDDVIEVDGLPQASGMNDPTLTVAHVPPGGILLTRSVCDCVKSRLDVPLREMSLGGLDRTLEGGQLFSIDLVLSSVE